MNKLPDPAAASAPPRDESFAGRWSRRKRAEPEKREDEDGRVAAQVEQQRVAEEAARGPARAAPATPPADLPDIDSLTADSDYSRFMKADVPLASRNAAMKKLFTDPHFNVMDGLDTYIDDYTKADPIPESMLRGLAQSRMLKLFNYDKEDAEDAAELVRLRAERAAAEAAEASANDPVTAIASPFGVDPALATDSVAMRASVPVSAPGPTTHLPVDATPYVSDVTSSALPRSSKSAT